MPPKTQVVRPSKSKKDEAIVDDIRFDGLKEGINHNPNKWSGLCAVDGSHWLKGDQITELLIAGGKNQYFSAKRIEFFGFDL